MPGPFFSIVITTYNRADVLRRCLHSCLGQAFPDYEVVVVDDGSGDGTMAMLEHCDDPRLRVVAHEENRGINPARHSGTVAARGEWIVVVDSDDELLPHTLERLHEIIAALPPGVRVVRSRLQHDDGNVTPTFVPPRPYGYEGRIRWAEAEGGNDAGRCLHRDALATAPYIADRRGAMETLFELNLAERETSVCADDVLGLVHADAHDSWLRNANARQLIPRLRREAPDMLWMAETALDRHGAALAHHGPCQLRTLLRVAAMQAFLLGERKRGRRYAWRALRSRWHDPQVWATLVLGMLGPRAAALGAVAYRKLGSGAPGSRPRFLPRPRA